VTSGSTEDRRVSMGITGGPESDDGTENQSTPAPCANCGAIVTQRFCPQCGTRRAVSPALIPSNDAPRVSRPGSTVPDQASASTPGARSAAVGRLRALKGTTRVGIAAGTIAVIGVISWAAIGSSSGGSLRGSGNPDQPEKSVKLGESFQYEKATLAALNAYYALYDVRVHMVVTASDNGFICPTAGDIYLLTGAGQRIEMSQSNGSCQTLNNGEEGLTTFRSLTPSRAPKTGSMGQKLCSLPAVELLWLLGRFPRRTSPVEAIQNSGREGGSRGARPRSVSPIRVFDWERAADRIREVRPSSASTGCGQP